MSPLGTGEEVSLGVAPGTVGCCYDEHMGFRFVIERTRDAWTLGLSVGLTRAESAQVFMSGDSLLQWPVEGLKAIGNLPLERTSIFISEAAAHSEGLELEYAECGQAERAGAILRKQLVEAGIDEEAESQIECQDPSADFLKDILAEYLTIKGMRAAILVSDQGLMISCAAAEGVDTASISALVIDTIASAQNLGTQVHAGSLNTMTVEYENLTLLLAPFSQDVMLVIVAEPGFIAASPSKQEEAS